jgi:hypothetical protein
MKLDLTNKLFNFFFKWLNKEIEAPHSVPLCDFNKLRYELRPCDVLLIEGRNRISQMIKVITRSSWSHAALYIGRLYDIEDKNMQKRITEFYSGDPSEQLVFEGLLGKGALISPLKKYEKEHIRICRPRNISYQEGQKIIDYAIKKLGIEYDFRLIFDLGRFLMPWPLLPRRWHSTLFNYKPGMRTKESCSSLLAEAFQSINFPILPTIKSDGKSTKLYKINPRLYSPRDFDYSPYFDIIKYPMYLAPTEINQRLVEKFK